jgi:1-acyl-sn-glycerol-3-phosphate acyltransferase
LQTLNNDQPPAGTVSLYLRSLAFWFVFALLILVFATLLMLSFPFPLEKRFLLTQRWSRLVLWWLKVTCKLDYAVEGTENIPDKPGIVFCKHQSTWETTALNLWFTPQSWVIKRELLWIPIFGWGARMMKPIALDRGAGRKAVEQLLREGREHLHSGRWILVFPEGTRIAAGKTGRYRIGGASLAEFTGAPVTPVAHNAGEYWPRRGLVKHPGVIRVRIGPAIETKNKSAAQILAESKQWIETEMAAITTLQDHHYGVDDTDRPQAEIR